MRHVTSQDGTYVAYEVMGKGPAVILIGGRIDREENRPLAELLADSFTVYIYDQRGRGESGHTLPFALDREIEDLHALIAEAGGSAHVYGASARGALGLEAAAAGCPIDKLAVYDVPYGVTGSSQQWRACMEKLEALLVEGRRSDAFIEFMRITGATEDDIAAARSTPLWPMLQAVAHTLPYRAAVLGDGQPPTGRLATITQPTLVLCGTRLGPHMNQLRPGVFHEAADAIAASIPRAQRKDLDGQTHLVDPQVIAPVLTEFFGP